MACEYLEKTQDQQLNIVEALNKTRCETRYELKHCTTSHNLHVPLKRNRKFNEVFKVDRAIWFVKLMHGHLESTLRQFRARSAESLGPLCTLRRQVYPVVFVAFTLIYNECRPHLPGASLSC